MSMEIPPRRRPENDAGYLEELTKAVFRAGFSWPVVRDKWPNFQQAFDQFDVNRVAAYDERDVERLVDNPGIVRNGRKIEATIHNARVMRELIAEHGSFAAYLRNLDGLTYAQRRKKLTDQFAQLGPTSVFVFLFCVDEEVPDWEERAL